MKNRIQFQLIGVLLLMVALIGVVRGHGFSMENTLNDGDLLLCIRPLKIKKGGIYVFKASTLSEKRLIKRCIGLSGDTLVFRDDCILEKSLIYSPKEPLEFYNVEFLRIRDYLEFNSYSKKFCLIPIKNSTSYQIRATEKDIENILSSYNNVKVHKSPKIDSFWVKERKVISTVINPNSKMIELEAGFFMLGDNYYESRDSRNFGTIKRRDISFRAVFRVFRDEEGLHIKPLV